MERWTQLIQQPLYLAGAAVLVAILVLVWLFFRNRRPKAAPKAAPEQPEGLWRIVTAYEDSHPSFFYILQSFQANHTIDQLCRNREVMDAFQRLDRLRGGASSRTATNKRTPSLQLSSPVANNSSAPQAAMTTILRSIFHNADYARDLPNQAHEELDRFLDSLTL